MWVLFWLLGDIGDDDFLLDIVVVVWVKVVWLFLVYDGDVLGDIVVELVVLYEYEF